MKYLVHFLFIALAWAICIPAATAQKSGDATVRGTIVAHRTGKPIASVAVNIPEYDMWMITDQNGRFEFTNVPAGKARLTAQCLGKITCVKELDIKEGEEVVLEIKLKEQSYDIKEIEVVAEENQTGYSTASSVSEKAIEHIQSNSLGDVLQLIPGQVIDNPDLSNANQATLRQASYNKLNALGTAVIQDGAPLSNNADMQVSNTSSSGLATSFSSVSGKGVDLRQISTDNVESIEVIRGIPSVEYGDLTSGALMVNTKTGESPYEMRIRKNPKTTQLYAGKGFDLGAQSGNLNVNVDYVKSVDDQRVTYRGYKRLTGDVKYSNHFLPNDTWYSETKISLHTTLDEEKQDPDDDRYKIENRSRDRGLRLNTSGKLKVNKSFARTIKYNASASYAHQVGYRQKLITGYIYPLSSARQDTTMPAELVPSSYLSQVDIDGKPISAFFKVTNSFFHKIAGFNHKFTMGGEWRTDGNNGKGRIYDVTRPPRTGGGMASRPRSYRDIPFLHQLSFYAEDNIHGELGGRDLKIGVGLRYDNFQPTGLFSTELDHTVLSPRLNIAFEAFENFKVRGGYGLTSKSPALVHLYPDNAYFDLINYNYYPENVDERLIIVSTSVFNSEPEDLKPMTKRKAEVGFDFNLGDKTFTITAFDERLENGYSFGQQIQFIPVEKYQASSYPEGEPPVLDPQPAAIDTFIASYNQPGNYQTNESRGVEFDFKLGQIQCIRTSVQINGAYTQSKSYHDREYIYKRRLPSGDEPDFVGIYPSGRGTKDERFNTTVRLVHHIPEFNLVASLSMQNIWIKRHRDIGYAEYPIGYIDKSGNKHYLTREEAEQEKFEDLVLPYNDYHYTEADWPALWLMNFRLSKDINKDLGFAFFANNVFMHRPLHCDTRTNRYRRRNPSLFFGAEMYLKIK
jgi:outer membrane receptor for ferrienterochelin and colicin